MNAITINDINLAMAHLLVRESFDDFFLDQAEVLTFASLIIGGKRNQDWYDEPKSKKIYWKEIKEIVFSYIKGKQTPGIMRVSLQADSILAQRVYYDAGMLEQYRKECPKLNLSFKYENNSLTVITGMAYQSFSLDKQLEYVWDDWVKNFFKGLGIA